MQVSPLAPDSFPDLPDIAGIKISTTAAQIKYKDRPDLLLVTFDENTEVAGVFTQSLTASAPVEYCRKHLQTGKARALVVNSGNANAFTGAIGEQHCQTTCQVVAEKLNCNIDDIFVASTGVIGEPLPIQNIVESIPRLADNLSPSSWQNAAQTIMTTDTFAKGASIETDIGGTKVRINGFAKGSGMIAPDMATMLAFVFTDASIPASLLQQLIEEANAASFNAITVDSDTSTSDTCLLFATSKAENKIPDSLESPDLQGFRYALKELMLDLAKQVVRDGEGATKLIRVSVSGAQNNTAAHHIANSIANSPLVKTAIAGEDANWGRVVMAVGKSGQRAERDRLAISMGGIQITENGLVIANYDETLVANHLKRNQIDIDVDVGVGQGEFTVWTCDLTHGYISINADYRS